MTFFPVNSYMDIFENEGRLMNLYKDPEFKKRKEHYTAVCEPTPAPSKQK